MSRSAQLQGFVGRTGASQTRNFVPLFFDVSLMQENTRRKMRLEVVREVIRLRHLSYTTEKHYLDWIRRFVRFNGRRHPAQMGEEEIASFLSHLAIARNCSPSTQGQALNALMFLFKDVLSRVSLPHALSVKYPKADREWAWKYLIDRDPVVAYGLQLSVGRLAEL